MITITVIYDESVVKELNFEGKKRISLGRTKGNDVEIVDLIVSREHCVIEKEEDGNIYIRDLNSKNGTYVNAERVEKALLHDGDRISLGKHIIVFRTDEYEKKFKEKAAPTDEEIEKEIDKDLDSLIAEDTSSSKKLLQMDDVEQLVPDEDNSKKFDEDFESQEKDVKDKPSKIKLGKNFSKNTATKRKIKIPSKLTSDDNTNRIYPKVIYMGHRKGEKTLKKDLIVIGSDKSSDIYVKELLVAKQQAIIERTGDEYMLRHTGKMRKTLVNDAPITETKLKSGDIIKIGNFEMQFVLPKK